MVSVSSERQYPTGVLLPRGSFTPLAGIHRKRRAIIGIVAGRTAGRRKRALPRGSGLARWANDRVISANQIGDCLTPARRSTVHREEEEEKEA